jgi:hypothetical protein
MCDKRPNGSVLDGSLLEIEASTTDEVDSKVNDDDDDD